jgi:hypothetical protein
MRSVNGSSASQVAAMAGCGVVVQHHAGQQGGDLRLVHRVLGGHVVDLGHVVLGVRQAVDERALVGEQQDAGGVFVEPAYGLHTAVAQWHRQQAQHAGVVARLARAFIARRLVQQHHGLRVRPRHDHPR